MRVNLMLSALLVFGLATALHAQDHNILISSKVLTAFKDENTVFKLQDEQLSEQHGLLRYYALTGYREGVLPIVEGYGLNFKAQINKDKGTHRIKMYNLSIQDMLTHGLWKSGRVILKVKDPARYRYEPAYGDEKAWLSKNGYCFEMMMPVGVMQTMDPVNEELCRLFKVKCSIEKRRINNAEQDVFVITEL